MARVAASPQGGSGFVVLPADGAGVAAVARRSCPRDALRRSRPGWCPRDSSDNRSRSNGKGGAMLGHEQSDERGPGEQSPGRDWISRRAQLG